MADTMTFGGNTYTNNEAGYNQFVSDVNAGKLHVEDFAGNFFSSENKLDDYLLDNFKDKNLSIVTYANEDGTHSMKIVDPNNAAEVDALKNIKIPDTNGNGAADISQYSHGTWEEEDALKKMFDGQAYKSDEAVIIHSNSPQGGGDIIAGTDEAAARGAKSAEITNNIIGGQNDNVNINSQGYSLGNWHNLNNLKNIDFSQLGPDGKINICMDSLPSFGPFTTSIDKHVEAFKELCKDPEFVKHLGEIDFQLDGGTGSDNKFHPPKATAEFWDKCMEDPELKKILEDHTTQETKDKIAGIDRNEKSYWDKLQMGIIIAVAVIAVITIVAVCVHLYRKHKKKKAQKKAEQLLNQGQGNMQMMARPVMYYPMTIPSNYQSYYNLQSCAPQQTMNQGNAAPNYQNYYQKYQQQYQYMMNNNQQSNYNLQNVGQVCGKPF
ncbi:MAG: hypothetical protein IJT14_00915 [Rickettsiales bacterium]|nr:hypothetical protein [Rickettsiales bacterium]